MSTELIEIPQQNGAALTLIRPIAKPADLLVLHDEVTAIIQKSLTQGIDYDAIPGTGDKPSLLKPGAEKLNLAFGASAEYEIVEKEIEHDREVRWTKRKKKWLNRHKGDREFAWEMEDGVSLGLYRYVVRCKIVQGGRLLAECIGTCSTLESKYIDRPRDCENTALKMAQKRAYVGATLHAYALSNRFTQDVEDNRDHYAKEPPVDIPFAPKREETKPAPPPRQEKATGYDGSDAHADILGATLKKRGVPPELWATIGERMLGKSFPELEGVLESLRAEAAG